jgi:hypothetical protein
MISMMYLGKGAMMDPKTQQFFNWLDWAFWLIWLGFLALIWQLVREVQNSPATLAALAPDQAACIAALPQPALFSPAGKSVFWGGFAVEMAIYAVLLVMAHQVIHRCATGQIFVAPMITTLRRIGLMIAAFPVIDLLIQNISAWAYVQTGDMVAFSGAYALNIPILGVGLLLVTMAAAMRIAVQMHEDAELTI